MIIDKYECYGFPTNSIPFESLLNVKTGVPIFKKSKATKTYYCAGYYLLNNKILFCPKSTTLENKYYSGPYKTIEEIVKI